MPALDSAFDETLLRSGERAVFFRVNPELKTQLLPAAAAAAQAVAAGSYRNYERDRERVIPDFARPPEEPDEDLTMPEPPPENATTEELLDYAKRRPDVRKVMRLFRAELVDIRRTGN